MFFVVPLGPLQEHAVDETAVIGLALHLSRVQSVLERELERDAVNRDHILATEVLKSACHEGLREEEPADPEYLRSPVDYPIT